jgi:hypothetical protein
LHEYRLQIRILIEYAVQLNSAMMQHATYVTGRLI